MDQVSSWMRRLARTDHILAPLPAGRSGYGVFAGHDRRRRPLARVRADQVRSALSDGLIRPYGQGLFKLSEKGQALVQVHEPAQMRPALNAARKAMPSPDGGVRLCEVNTDTVSVLARYARPSKGRPALLDPVHLSAADILLRDYESSALSSRVTQDWSGIPGAKTRSAPKDRADAPLNRLHAQSRVLEAFDAVGAGLDHLLTQVLIREVGMGAAERHLNWPERSGAPALRMALDRLAVHYQLKPRPEAFNPFADI